MARIAGYFSLLFVSVFRWRGIGSLNLQILPGVGRSRFVDLRGIEGAIQEVGERWFAGHGDPGFKAFFEKLEAPLLNGPELDWLDRFKMGAMT